MRFSARIPHFNPKSDQLLLIEQPGRAPTRPGFFMLFTWCLRRLDMGQGPHYNRA